MCKKIYTIILSALLILATAVPTMASDVWNWNMIRTSNGNIYSYSAAATGGEKRNYPHQLDLSFIGKGEIEIHYGGKNDIVTSSNTKVASIYKKKHVRIKNKYNYFLKIKKTGGTLINRNNSRYMYIRVNSYKNACKSFKIGNKEYAGNFKYKPVMGLGLAKNKKLKGKVIVKPAKGWKLVRIQMKSTKPKNKYQNEYYFKTIKNKSTITLKGWNNKVYSGAKDYKLSAIFQSEKTGEYSFAEIYSGPVQKQDGLILA